MTPFVFHTKVDQTLLLGERAKNLRELLQGLRSVPPSCIYFHTHRYLRQHHFLSPEPPNDFAYWITDVLNEPTLGERVSSLDIVQFQTLEDLRGELVEIIESHLKTSTRTPTAPTGQEFYFMAARTFVFRTPFTATTVGEFRTILEHVPINSLYYHIFEAKLRLKQGENDFSRWFRDNGFAALADRIQRLDPYTYTLEGLRHSLLSLVDTYGTH